MRGGEGGGATLTRLFTNDLHYFEASISPKFFNLEISFDNDFCSLCIHPHVMGTCGCYLFIYYYYIEISVRGGWENHHEWWTNPML